MTLAKHVVQSLVIWEGMVLNFGQDRVVDVAMSLIVKVGRMPWRKIGATNCHSWDDILWTLINHPLKYYQVSTGLRLFF